MAPVRIQLEHRRESVSENSTPEIREAFAEFSQARNSAACSCPAALGAAVCSGPTADV